MGVCYWEMWATSQDGDAKVIEAVSHEGCGSSDFVGVPEADHRVRVIADWFARRNKLLVAGS